MRPITIVTDSCSSLPDDVYARHNMVMVPYFVHIGLKSYRDLMDISRADFLQVMRQDKELPKSANPGVGDYLSAYRDAAKNGKDIISVHMTSIGSGAYQAALVAKEMAVQETPGVRIEVVDTRNVSMAHGWMALEAARAAEAGASVDETLALVQRMIPVSRMLQTADTLRYLYLGGRIGRAQHLVGSVLNIKPIISMEDGVIVALGQERSRPAVFRRIVSLVQARVGRGSRIKAAIVHADDRAGADALGEMVSKAFDCAELLVTELSSALAVHTGPGTVGVCYFPEAVLGS